MSSSKSSRRIPKLQHHKASGRAVVSIQGRDHYCGAWGTPEADAEYRRVIAEALAGAAPDTADDPTVAEIIARYLRYLGQVNATPRVYDIAQCAGQVLARFYGHTPAQEFGPKRLNAVRRYWVDENLARSTINDRINAVKNMFRYACAVETIPPSIYHGLTCLPPLRRGETKPAAQRCPVKPEHIEAIKPYVSASVWALVRLLRLTGARPGALLGLRAADIDRTGDVWEYRPEHHKTEHMGRTRVIFFGKEAQSILRPFLLKRRADEPLFSPWDRFHELAEAAEGHRRPDQKPDKRKTDRRVGAQYDAGGLRKAIERACRRADAEAKARAKERGDIEVPEIPVWTPYQLRHTAATEIRKRYGLEAAQVILGHSTARVTEIYALVDEQKARTIASEMG